MRHVLFVLLGLCLGLGVRLDPAHAQARGELVYLGVRTGEAGQGIYAAWFNKQDGSLTPIGVVAQVHRPTWVEAHPTLPYLYAVNDPRPEGGSLVAFAVNESTGALREINRTASGGVGPTHLTVEPRSRTLFAAHYVSGSVAAFPIRRDGGLDAVTSLHTHTGSGPNPRQATPHAHSVDVDPSRRFLLTSDLGADRVFVYNIAAATHQLTPAATPSVTAPPGAGPRHLAFHPNGRFVFLLAELTTDVLAYRWTRRTGVLDHFQSVPTTTAAFQGEKSAAEIGLSRDGRFLYTTNRGENTIVAFAVNAHTGQLTEIQRVASGGVTPWNFAIDRSGRWLLVANTASNAITAFRRDPRTGLLSAPTQAMSIPEPSNVTFFRP